MAGDWIPCELTLFTKREVMTIARKTKRSRFEIAGLLLAFWGWFSTESADGRVDGIGLDTLADIIGADHQFWAAVADEGWIRVTKTGLFIPNSDRWITKGAKARLQQNRRQAAWRDGKVDDHVDGGPSTPPSQKPSTTVQKSREEKSITRPGSAQKHRFQAPQPPAAGPVDTPDPDPDPDGALTLTLEQQRLVNELRDLTGETDRPGYYRALVVRLGEHVWRVKAELQLALNDRASPVENRGALLTTIAKRIAGELGIALFPARRVA